MARHLASEGPWLERPVHPKVIPQPNVLNLVYHRRYLSATQARLISNEELAAEMKQARANSPMVMVIISAPAGRRTGC